MISLLVERSVVYGLLAALCFGAGWKVNGWRYGAQIAQAEAAISAERAEVMRLVLAEQDVGAARMAAIDKKFTGELTNAETQIAELERRVAAGPARLYVAAKCPTAEQLPKAGEPAGLGVGGGQRAELDPGLRQDYFAIRRGIVKLEAALRICVNSR